MRCNVSPLQHMNFLLLSEICNARRASRPPFRVSADLLSPPRNALRRPSKQTSRLASHQEEEGRTWQNVDQEVISKSPETS